MKIRKLLAVLLVLAMVVGFCPAFDLGIEADAAEPVAPAKTDVVFDYIYDISPYRSAGRVDIAKKISNLDYVVSRSAKEIITNVYRKYPAKEGYVFAGWYSDVKLMSPLGQDVTEGSAYAKFVPEGLIKAVAQVSIKTDHTTEASALRFIAAVDDLDYNQIGFTLTKKGVGAYVHSSTKVYTSLSAALEGATSVTPTYFNPAGQFMYALTLTGIDDQTQAYTAKPFWITNDGTLVNHVVTGEKTVEMGVAANVAAGKTQIDEDTLWFNPNQDVYTLNTAEELQGFARMSKTYDFAGKTIKLGANITFNEETVDTRNWFAHNSSTNTWSVADGVELWTGIGSAEAPFAGTFDGQGFSIRGLAMLGTGRLGLISTTSGATVKNVRVEDSTFRNLSATNSIEHSTGALIAHATNTTVTNVYSDAYLAYGNTMGLVAHAAGTTNISNCWFAGTLNGAWGNVRAGGIVGMGYASGTTINIDNCLFTGVGAATFNTGAYVGGIMGIGNYGNTVNITNCLSAGNLNAAAFKGATNGSVIGNTPGGGKGTYTNVYATNECYVNSEGTSVAIGNGTKYTGAPVLLPKADFYGELAKTNAPNLAYGTAWAVVADSTPILLDTSWYDSSATEYTIYTAEQLKGLAELTQNKANTFKGKTIKLGADIVYNEGNAADWATTPPANVWAGIGENDNGFLGTFDGQGHTISGLYCVQNYAALVSRLYSPGVVKNVRVVNSYFKSTGTDKSYSGAGIVARLQNATVSGVYTDAILVSKTCSGIVASVPSGTGTVSNCWFDGTIDANEANGTSEVKAGGIIGSHGSATTHTISNCLFTGTFTGPGVASYGFYGGLIGLSHNSSAITITNSLVAGDLTGITAGYPGAITGHNPNSGSTTCTNVYATAETCANLKGSGGGTFTGASSVAEANILGTAATSALTGFDFKTVWYARTDDVPRLQSNHKDMDTSWYDASASEYVLYDAADLYGFSYLAEATNFKGKTIKLGADIVLNEGDAKTWATTAPANVWDPIGKSDASLTFEGTFDGQGHTISGLYYDSALYGGGLFVYTGTSAVIKNLKLTNSYIRSTHGAEWSATGSVVAFVNGTDFINVYSDAIIDSNSGYTGGIGGRVQGNGINVENCEFAGKITTTGSVANYIGGIMGGFNTNTTGASTFTDCVVSGTVTGNTVVGGIAGRSSGAAGSTVTVDGYTLTGILTAYNSTSSSTLGGLFGLAEMSTLTVKNVHTGGTVNATLGIGGGFIGMVSTANVTIQYSSFSGAVNGGTKLGGFVGRTNTTGYTTTVENSIFSGTVTATNTNESTIAGIVAHVNNGDVTIRNCITGGTLVAPGPYAGGIIGQAMNVANTITVSGCTATPSIQNGSSTTAAVIGALMGTNPECTISNTFANATFQNEGAYATAQVVGNARSNATTMTNVVYAVPSGSSIAANAVKEGAGSVTGSTRKLTHSRYVGAVQQLYEAGMYPDFAGFLADNTISDAQDLYGFLVASESKDFSGETVTLAADITVNDEATYGSAYTWDQNEPKYGWTPLAFVADSSQPSYKPFAGTFDGQGYTISGIYCAHSGGNGMGLFSSVTGTVKNFRLENSYFENMASVGYGYNASIVAALDGGTVSQVYSNAVMKTVDSWAAGIVSMVEGESVITECQFDGSLLARCNLHGGCLQSVTGAAANEFQGGGRSHAVFVGGIAGCVRGTSLELSNCLYTGKIYNECTGAHRTGGIIGGINEGDVTMTGCISTGNFVTLNNTGNNSYHFSMLLDCRGLGGSPVNAETLYQENYIISRYLYAVTGEHINLGQQGTGDLIAGAYECKIPALDENGDPVLDDEGNPTYENVTAVRYRDVAALNNKMATLFASKTGNLDFNNVWRYEASGVPSLRFGDTSNPVSYTYHGVEENWTLFVPMDGVQTDTFTDKDLVATDLGKTTTGDAEGDPLYSVEQVESTPVDFVNIDYSDGAYITKYIGTTLTDYETYVAKLITFGFQQVAANVLNTDDAYYTALSFGNRTYSITHFANTGETYVTVSSQMKHSPFMSETYYQEAVNTEDGEPETRYDNIQITTYELSEGGLCQVIRLKNGHYIVVDGGTGHATVGTTVINQDTGEEYTIKADKDCADETEIEYNKKIRASRAELAAALGATVRPIYGIDEETGETVIVDYEDPAVIVDAWIFTHDHYDHAGWLYGGVFGAMQVDVYIKGFYYNFSNTYRVPMQVEVGEDTDEEGNTVPRYADGYANQFYTYQSTVDGVDEYTMSEPQAYGFWVEYSAANKTAANVNTPSWGKRNIPVYRIQAGQKFYFDGITLEIPYTQDQIQPVDYDNNLNASSAWLLFTDEHGNTYLEAGDAELVNQKAVIELYDDFYDGGEGTNYALFGADVVNGFHHGQNLWVETTGDYTVVNTIFGICNESGDASEANTAENGEDGRTKLIFYTRGYLGSLFGYLSDHTSADSRMMQANHYLTGYVYPELIESSLASAKAFPNLTSPIAFTSTCTKPDGKGVSWQGTTTVTFGSEGVTWDKQQAVEPETP